jgi:hypothetical protein
MSCDVKSDSFENPFGLRGRINDAKELFDRTYELSVLRSHLLNGTSCQIVGPSGFGKSSLLFLLGSFAESWNKRLRVGYLDLQDPRCHTVSGFLECAWSSWKMDPEDRTLASLSERFGEWTAQGSRMVLCLDEFEDLTRHPREFTADFFLGLRAIAQKGMILVTGSRRTLSYLVPSTNPVSPFFNIFGVIRLGPFSDKDAANFVTLERPNVPKFTEMEKRAILDFAMGHPLALQIACFHVLESKRSGETLDEAMNKASIEIKEALVSDERLS